MADSWETITPGLPVGDIGINYIAVSDTDEDVLWVALSGYEDGEKVYFSENGGNSWTNVSGTLPNVPVNTIVYENGSDNRVYVGTDIGVFYRDDLVEDWQVFMDGLPNVMVHELEINYTSEKLVAATYGRGIWQSDLAAAPTMNTIVGADTYCNDESINVDYACTISFDAGNELTVQLSDESGDFASAVVIGTMMTTSASGTIPCVIPADAANGDAYRIRVISSSPVVVGDDNAFDISIGCPEPSGLNAVVETETEVLLSWDEVLCAESYEVRYREEGGSWIGSTSDVNSKTITGLVPSTVYEWSVQAICLTDPISVESGYAADESFNTANVGIVDFADAGFTLYPNPAEETVTITLQLQQSENVIIVLTDIKGSVADQISLSGLAAGEQKINIPRNGMVAGVYTLSVEVDSKVYATELIWR